MDNNHSEDMGGARLPARAVRLIPWLIASAWLAATILALGLFELRLPKGVWCLG